MSLGPFTPLARSRFVDKDVVRLHGDKIKIFILYSSSKLTVSSTALLACMSLMDSLGHSARLRSESMELLPPYVALGFDHKMVGKKREQVVSTMGTLRSIEHLSLYVAFVRQRQLLTL